MGAKRVAVLLNVKASGVTERIVEALRPVVPADALFVSRRPSDAQAIAGAVVGGGFTDVLLGGGDGTAMCFINAVCDERLAAAPDSPLPRFGILKLGTGNALASALNASDAWDDGFVDDVQRVVADQGLSTRTVDLVLVDGLRAPFAGLGVDALIQNDYEWVKKNLGQGPFEWLLTGPSGYFTSVVFRTVPNVLSGAAAAVRGTIRAGQAPAFRLDAEGEVVAEVPPGALLHEGPLLMVAAGTVPFYGFELKMFPFAGRRPGHLHLRYGNLATADVLSNLPAFWAGEWFPEGLYDFLARDVEVALDAEAPFQVGGDARGMRRAVRFQVAPERLTLLQWG